MDKRIIRLTESDLHNVIMESVSSILNEVFDINLLNDVDSIDVRSINKYIKEMIPLGNRVGKSSPYKPIRQLVLYFSEEGARKHGGRLTKDIVNNMLKNDAIRNAVVELTRADKNIMSYIYGDNKLTGKPLMQRIIWEMDEILKILMKLNQEYEKSGSQNWFGHTEAIKGSDDKKRIGLGEILYNALMGVTKIKELMSKMQKLVDKERDPFSYRV